MDKLKRIIAANGLDIIKTKYIETKKLNGKNLIIVETDGVKYELDGNNKRIIEKPKEFIVEPSEDIQKPRGWHFRPIYVDVVGNVYFKGELQPELKDKYDQEGNLI